MKAGKSLDARSLENIASLVRKAIATNRYALFFREPHVFDRMYERDIGPDDVLDALRGCRLVDRHLKGNWRYTANGKTFDGREIGVVLEIYVEREEVGLLVITVWRIE